MARRRCTAVPGVGHDRRRLRSFVDGGDAEVALVDRYRPGRLDELWLDHDLGEDDTIWPVVELLERAAFDGAPFDIGAIHIHSANPAGADRMLAALRRWGYPVHITPASDNLEYRESPPAES